MSASYQIACTSCTNLNDINEMVCSHCGVTIPDTINVRRASLPQEKLALEARYAHAMSHLTANNLAAEAVDLENAVKTNG